MNIVVDTNCLLVSVKEYSEFHWLWRAFLDKKYVMVYTGEILNEYQEILENYYSVNVAQSVIDIILEATNAMPVTQYYRWNMITADPDDNKFVDCAVAANAHYLVTNDHHFDVLKSIDFPKVNTVTIFEFKEII